MNQEGSYRLSSTLSFRGSKCSKT